MRIFSKLLVLGAALAVSTSMAYADTLGPGAIAVGPTSDGQAVIHWTDSSIYYNPFGAAIVTNASGSLKSFQGKPVGVNGFSFSEVSATTPVGVFFTNNGTDELTYYLTSLTVLIDSTAQLDVTGTGYLMDSGYTGQTPADLIIQSSGQATSYDITSNVSPTPEPGSLMLLGTGLLSAAGIARKKFASKLS